MNSEIPDKSKDDRVSLAMQRWQVVAAGLEAFRRGIVHGAGGNLSIRDDDTGLIATSPVAMACPTITPAYVVIVDENAVVRDDLREPGHEMPSANARPQRIDFKHA